MKFYKQTDVAMLLEVLKDAVFLIEHGDDLSLGDWGSIKDQITEEREAFAKIEPVSVPEFDLQETIRECKKHSWYYIPLAFEYSAKSENERIRKIMEGEK